MTNRPLSEARPAPGGAAGPGQCPEPESLSAYLEGKLSDTERAPIEDHISRCEDCYFVVRETAAVVGELAQSEAGSEEPIPLVPRPESREPQTDALRGPGRSRAAFAYQRWGAIAAGILTLLGGGGYVARERGLLLPAHERVVRPLVEAVGERRFFEARLTGGFKHGPLISPTRGGAVSSADPREPHAGPIGPASEDWGILAAAARIRETNAAKDSAEAAASLAAAHLVLGETDAAVTLLARAADANPGNPRVHSDLAASYLRRAETANRPDDYARAAQAADKAIAIDPTLSEALYNKALALESMGRTDEAIKAWDAFLGVETDAAWRAEADKRRGALRKSPGA